MNQPSPYTPDDVLDKLIRAGLGNVNQNEISPYDYERAMRGEIVRRENGSRVPACLCGRRLTCKQRAIFHRWYLRKKQRRHR